MKIIVPEEYSGIRLDKFLSTIPEIGTRSRASHLIDLGNVLVNGKPTKASFVVRTSDTVEIIFPEKQPAILKASDIPLDVLFEDDELLVVNKPAGLVVHPGAGNSEGTLVNALIHHTRNLSMKFGEDRPGIVHRIDKETSGLLVVAKNDFAHEKLALQFKERRTHRIYQAICFGCPPKKSGNISSYLLRHPTHRQKYASTKDDSGKWASTNYQVLSQASGLCLLQLKLDTGRTHQIRVHLSEMGNPIVGDKTYGAHKKVSQTKESIKSDIENLGRFLLHAMELGFYHPKTSEWMSFHQPWPETEIALIQKWGLA